MDESLKDRIMPVSNYEDLILEAKAKKALKPTMTPEVLVVDKPTDMEMTKEIESFSDEVLEKLDEMKKDKEDDMPLETSFIYCAILGFIVLFIGYAVYLYIMSHI